MDEFAELLRAEGLDDAAIGRVHAGLARAELVVTMNYFAAQRRAREARAAEKKKAEADRLRRALPYDGRIEKCQASRIPDRGAPTRCLRPVKFITRQGIFRTDPFAACRGCVKAGNILYTGWGGDPNPKIVPVEAEWIAKLDAHLKELEP